MVTYKIKRKIKRPISPIKVEQIINYKDLNLLKKFMTKRGKILSRRITNLTFKQQNELKKAIKCARILNLLPFVKYKNLQL